MVGGGGDSARAGCASNSSKALSRAVGSSVYEGTRVSPTAARRFSFHPHPARCFAPTSASPSMDRRHDSAREKHRRAAASCLTSVSADVAAPAVRLPRRERSPSMPAPRHRSGNRVNDSCFDRDPRRHRVARPCHRRTTDCHDDRGPALARRRQRAPSSSSTWWTRVAGSRAPAAPELPARVPRRLDAASRGIGKSRWQPLGVDALSPNCSPTCSEAIRASAALAAPIHSAHRPAIPSSPRRWSQSLIESGHLAGAKRRLSAWWCRSSKLCRCPPPCRRCWPHASIACPKREKQAPAGRGGDRQGLSTNRLLAIGGGA